MNPANDELSIESDSMNEVADAPGDKLTESSLVDSDPPRLSDSSTPGGEFHVVGIGASAGGLEALELLFKALPSNTGMAFVVVQHLSPDFKSHMEQLLSRHTDMEIRRVENGMEVQPNCVFLIPPKMEMVISGRRLLLTAKSEGRTLSLPIDQFFRSLAADLGSRAIGIVLSGTGSDGSRGIRDIHKAGGLVVAQNPATAKFDGMPLSAQATGVVDLILSPAQVAPALVKYAAGGLSAELLAEYDLACPDEVGVERVFQLLNHQHRIDFSFYKASTVGRRIQRRMDMLGAPSLDAYLQRLEGDPSELNELYKDLLIGVTRFFRDVEAFEVLEHQVIPELLSHASEARPFRVWVAGCATGEEAYSYAILLDEEIRRRNLKVDVKIFATDAHHISLSTAARGVFSEASLNGISVERRARYFHSTREGYQVTRDLRRYIVFAPHNVINDPPFTQMDLVSCRNLLIYLQSPAQRKALSLFHFALRTGGALVLGPSESPGELDDEFSSIDKKWKIYRKIRDVRLPIDTRLPINRSSDGHSRSATSLTFGRPRIDAALLSTYDRILDRKMPPSILVSEGFEIVHTFGGAERYLRAKAGRPSNNLLDQVTDSLRTSLAGALQHALRKSEKVRYTGIRSDSSGTAEDLRLCVEPLVDATLGLTHLLVEFESIQSEPGAELEADVVDVKQLTAQRVSTLESELRYSQENLQATIEEMETSNEELQATNEELTAANEELQSTNEELHSVNEELYTVNAEHQQRLDELARANDDMDNLLATTRVGVIFLDEDLCIRRYTPEIARLFHLVPQDLGRSIEGFSHHLKYARLTDDLREVLDVQREKEVSVEDRHAARFLMRMMPYRAGADVSGVVMTLIDVTSTYRARLEVDRFQHMTECAADMMALVNRDGQIVYANPAFTQTLGFPRSRLIELKLAQLESSDTAETLYERALDQRVATLETRWRCADGQTRPVEVSLSRVDAVGTETLVSVIARDISERIALTGRLEEMGTMVEMSNDAIVVTDLQGKVLTWSRGAELLYRYTAEEAVGENLANLVTDRPSQLAAPQNENDWVGELERKAKDGATVTVSSRRQQILTKGAERRVLHIDRDITVQKVAQGELKRANEAAVQANIAKSSFLANISHELRTPMTAVLGFADILRSELKSPGNREKVDIIKRNGEYLLAILNDILDLSKIEAGRLEIERETVELEQFLTEIQDLMQVRALEEGIPLRFQFHGELPKRVTIDTLRARQILVNLIGNALKFTDEGEVTVSASLQAGSTPAISFAVVDTGVGLAEDALSGLFTPFSQASQVSARRYGGTGLGLSISKRLAENMGGGIDVESTLGVGSKFTLRLPIPTSDLRVLVEPRALRSSRPAALVDVPTVDAKVLVADDRRDVWRVAKYYLERAGARVVIVEDGRQAVDAVLACAQNGDPFDLVFMDIQMPIMTGRQAVELLRQNGQTLPIVALTSDAMEGEREACLAFGCTEYLAKPIDASKLVGFVQRFCGNEKVPPADGERVDVRRDSVIAQKPEQDEPLHKVLVVDDSIDAAMATALMLQHLGCDAKMSHDGATALTDVSEFGPSAIVLDLELPDMNGIEVAKRARKEGFSGTIIGVSGHNDAETIERSKRGGFDHFLVKPCDVHALLRLIQRGRN